MALMLRIFEGRVVPLKRRQERLWPPGNTEGTTISRSGGGNRILVLITVLLLCLIAGLASYLYVFEEARTGARDKITSTQEKPSTAATRRNSQANAPPPAPETFGLLPSELGAKPELGADAPQQKTPEVAADDAAREANHDASPDMNTGATQDRSVERRQEAALPQEPAPQALPPSPANAPRAVTPAPARPQVSPEFVATLRKRAAEAMTRSDIIAARLLLERASAGGDAQALEELARTYDPAVLEKMGLRGIIAADEQKAARLYNEAQQARASAQNNSR